MASPAIMGFPSGLGAALPGKQLKQINGGPPLGRTMALSRESGSAWWAWAIQNLGKKKNALRGTAETWKIPGLKKIQQRLARIQENDLPVFHKYYPEN